MMLSLSAKHYTFSGGEGSVGQKIAAKILKKAYEQAAISVSFEFKSFQQSLIDSNSGLNDGEISRVDEISNKFPNLIKIPVPIMSVDAVVFSKDTSIELSSWADLKGRDFMVIRGTKFIEKATKGYSKSYADTFDEAMRSLHKGKVDMVVVPKIGGVYSIYENGYKDIHIVSLSLQSLALYHFVHKKNRDLISKVTPFLEKMQRESKMRSIKEKYLMSTLHNR